MGFFFDDEGSEFLTTEMDEAASSVKQPRNMKSENVTVEAASKRNNLLLFQQKRIKNTKACWTRLQTWSSGAKKVLCLGNIVYELTCTEIVGDSKVL